MRGSAPPSLRPAHLGEPSPLRIASIASAFPANYYEQEQILSELGRQWGATPTVMSRLEAFHQRAGVRARHLALPKEDYETVRGFSARNREYVRVAVELGARALSDALAEAGVAPHELDHLFFVS